MSTRTSRIRRLASMTISIKFVWLLCLAAQVDFVVGRGPDTFTALPVWRFSMLNCSLFRNETVLRPKFRVWPEEAASVPFRYCCEYQPNGSSSTFELSNYTYGPDDGTLQPAPYYDLGIVEKESSKHFWRPHWFFWSLPQKQFSGPMLYCDVTDLRALYKYRFWHKAMKRGALSGAVLVLAVFVFSVFPLRCIGSWYRRGIYAPTRKPMTKPPEGNFCVQCGHERQQRFRDVTDEDLSDSCKDLARGVFASVDLVISFCGTMWRLCVPRQPAAVQPSQKDPPSLGLEEAFADVCHIVLLVLVSSSLMESIAHSPLGSWRSDLMFNAAVTYTYLTVFATISTWIRHCLLLELRHPRDWRWQKVFGQFAAQFMVGSYLVLVDDVTGHSLDSFAGLVLATCIGASVWSVGVELVVLLQYGWQRLLLPVYVFVKGKILMHWGNDSGQNTAV